MRTLTGVRHASSLRVWEASSCRNSRPHAASAGGVYGAGVSQLNEHLVRVQDIATRARDFRTSEASDPKAFSKTLVGDLAALAEAVAELIKRVED